MKRTWKLAAAALSLTFVLAGCSTTNSNPDSSTDQTGAADASTGMSGTITVISREEGSGTRGAFVELFGIEEKDADGNKVDHTTEEANVTNNTAGMITSVSGDKQSIGYVSLGSLNNKVKAVKIDGNEATVDNVKSGAYAVSRPFNIVTKDNMNDVAKDFVNFILSTDGQKIVEDNHYIPLDNATSFTSTKPSGKITVGGSSSVSPVMEKLIEAYKKVNSGATIELQTTDSTTGVTSTVEGTYQIGMASRDLKDEEVAQGVKSTKIAIDGIAVIVNNENSIDNLSKDQVKSIFTGEATDWSAIG